MTTDTLHALVNFRASKPLLESFDRVCFLSGKTRTQVLAEMMRQRVLKAGPRLASKAANEQAASDALKTAVETHSAKPAGIPAKGWSSALYERLKPFSSPDFDPVR